jgi:RNA polymerase sigma-70 factor (ECF subfamily)
MTSSGSHSSDPPAPALDDLRSLDPRVNAVAWQAAFPRLWQTSLQLLSVLLTGADHAHDREDIAARAVAELTRSLIGKNLPSFNQIRTFDDLLDMNRQIVRARTKDFFRQRGRRLEDPTAELPDSAANGPETDSSAGGEDFDALLALLPPPQPEIFRLHYEQGHTAEEISARLGLPRNTVLSHLFRGKKTLRKHLDGADPNAPGDGAPPHSP